MTLWIILVVLSLAGSSGGDLPAGVLFHLDAAGQAGGRGAAGLPGIGNSQPMDLAVAVLDAKPAITFQASPEHRPVYRGDGSAAFLQFDGQDDFLFWNLNAQPQTELTVFILAAPRTNAGNFSGFMALSDPGQNDYIGGFNFDFGPAPTKELSVLNVESAGAGGFRDLLQPGFVSSGQRPFGDFHVFTARTKPGKAGTQVYLDGFKGGERDREASRIGVSQLTVGARLYSNDPNQPPFAQGFFAGAMAEVLIFNRALTDPERQQVEEQLLAKTVALNALLHGAKGHGLEPVKDPPIVQVLVPGFTVEELPLSIGNLNNVRYRHDGKVVALGYDGRIHLLTDTNGDGLEDRDDLFWDQPTLRSPIGLALLPKDDPRGDGVLVASKGKVSLILDKDRDGRADEEKVIATGWNELSHGVDTLGLAVDPKDGSIYFGLGCANFVDAYQIDRASGSARYHLDDIHGTIQRLSADFSTRETICTGVRFTCALAFNRDGDLFATDQEGATWLPNGNPLDELLQIQRGKHYGFPPRHPKHLPNVIDQPAVSEFAPQHQSTVGMVFNEGVNGGPIFGPAHWAGDALICGESRGKIWRTRLAKTPLGYVAQNHLLACLGLLTVDACVTPAGDLLVACHSGPPDWGTGPAGKGRIFKLRYTGRDLPQPVLTWAAAPDEFRIAFDRPLNPGDWAQARGRVRVEAGRYVSAGDRFEVIRPGYQVVRDQMAAPRRWLDLLGLSLTDDAQTLVLRVPKQAEAVTYAVTLPLPAAWRQPRGIPQHPEMDLLADLHGLVAAVSGENQALAQTVLPVPSLRAAERLTQGSTEHERFFRAARQAGASVTYRGQALASNPFVPAVQPGSQLDWDMATDPFASTEFAVRTRWSGAVPADPSGQRLKRLPPVTLAASEAAANGLYLAKDSLTNVLNGPRVFVPWAVESENGQTSSEEARAQMRGHWLRGKRLFFGEVGCATCHTIRGEGTAFGPDLSNLVFRDRESVLADILHPSATINPDHAGTLVTLKSGATVSGLLRSPTADRITLALPAGAHTDIPRSDIRLLEPMKTSLMPEGLGDRLNPEQREDLLAFLLQNPLEPAPITRPEPAQPPPRRLSEVAAVVGSIPPPAEARPLRILLCAGPKDHGLNEHDYPLWLDRWSRLLRLADNVQIDTASAFPATQQLAAADVAVFYNGNPDWTPAKAAALDAFHRQGGGAVYLHFAVEGGPDPAGVAERLGLSFTLGSRFRHGEFDLAFSGDHPITRNFPALHFTDETYWNMRGDSTRLNILGTIREDDAPRPQLWAFERERSRIVACIPGHYSWTFDDPLYRVLVLRCICWAAKQENVDRLAELALIGASVTP